MSTGTADLQGEVRAEWTQFDKTAECEMKCAQIFQPFLSINGYRGRVKSIRGGLTPAALAFMAKSFANMAQAGWIPDEKAEPEMSRMFGIRMKYHDPFAGDLQLNGKKSNGKSKQSESQDT
jgi:hypothetical protein